jgi:hypothetical protein
MFYVLFMCQCVLPPGVNPIAVDKYINKFVVLMTPGTQILYHRISSGYRRRNLQRAQTEAAVVQFTALSRILLWGTEKKSRRHLVRIFRIRYRDQYPKLGPPEYDSRSSSHWAAMFGLCSQVTFGIIEPCVTRKENSWTVLIKRSAISNKMLCVCVCRVEPGYNDVVVSYNSYEASDILLYQLIPHC